MSAPREDPWTRVRTVHDLPADEVISALQKEIRRGNLENAAAIAWEMIETSPELERKLWDRLLVISAEDVGLGEPLAPVVVDALARIRGRFAYGEGDGALMAIHAVRYLATRRKERGSDELFAWIRAAFEREGLRPSIPEYAVDMHTARGAAAGRGLRHFYEEGAQVAPVWEERDETYRDRLMRILSDAGEGSAAG